jgi:hypothetical protein
MSTPQPFAAIDAWKQSRQISQPEGQRPPINESWPDWKQDLLKHYAIVVISSAYVIFHFLCFASPHIFIKMQESEFFFKTSSNLWLVLFPSPESSTIVYNGL